MVKHQETHPNLDVEGCFGCRIASLTFSVPAYMSARSQPGGLSGIEANHAMRKDMEKVLREDKEGRLQRV